MSTSPPSEQQPPRESGAKLHRRETNWQIYFPFLLGILGLVVLFLSIALPTAPVWRDRAQAIGDFMYILLCQIPLVLCTFLIYPLILVFIYGMRKAHAGTERPLRKLENAAASLAERITQVTEYVNEKNGDISAMYEPLDNALNIFDYPETEDGTTHEPADSGRTKES